jgi:predicted nucleotide-binding protein
MEAVPTQAGDRQGAAQDALDPALFIGSSSEGLAVAKGLQAEVDQYCEPTIWSQGVFAPGDSTLSSLLEASQKFDFAALILTPDDSIVKRGAQAITARDNVIFELGLFLGTLGPRRVFIIYPRGADLQLPSDLAGVTLLDYRQNRRDGNLRATMGPAATAIEKRVAIEGLIKERMLAAQPAPTVSAPRRSQTGQEERSELERELDAIEKSARAQGWLVRTHSNTAFRLVDKDGNRYSFSIGSPAETRDRLRPFAQQLKSAGLRISQVVLRPVNEIESD